MEEMTMFDSAMTYATEYGWKVFPVRKDKSPYFEGGYKKAKSNHKTIEMWWKERFPEANIGIACDMSDLLVVDIDKDDDTGKDGYQSLKQWERENGVKLPETATAITGRGGYHMYYRYNYHGTDADPQNRTGVLEGVDIRANGYVIAPPSVHANGNKYQWEDAPDEIGITEADEAVLMLCKYGLNSNGTSNLVLDQNEPIPAGARNSTLYRFGCSLQGKGVPDGVIASFISELNQTKCDPPLEDREVQNIVSSVLSKPKEQFRPFYDDMTQHDPVLEVSKKGNIIQSIPNAVEAIQFDKDLFGRILFNEMSSAINVYGKMPWESHTNNGRKKREWKNVDDSNLIAYLQKNYGLMNEKAIMHGLTIVADKHRFNPVKEFLESCQTVYSSGRYVRKLLPKYLGVEDTEYTYEVMHLFMLGAVCRVYHPGCKFDYVPIIVGEQGVGKSAFLRVLAGSDEWFADNFNTLDGDKASEKLRGMWMLEIAELSAMKRSKDVESIKSFITSVCDTYRTPYARRTESHPRCCVFAGTTNDHNFLTDTTGNRRFLPLKASKEAQEAMILDVPEEAKQDICMAWGEIMTEYQSYVDANKTPDLRLSKWALAEAEAMQNTFLEEDVRIPIIQEWLDTNPHITRVCAAMVYERALEGRRTDMTKKCSNEINTILETKIEGWDYVGRQRCEEYGKPKAYERVVISENPFEE